MKAVNLIPQDARRGAGAPGRSGGLVYVVLGVLGVLVVMLAAYVTMSKSITAKREQVASVTAQATAAEAQAGALQAYTNFAAVRATRQETVVSLATTRFDWSRALGELAHTVPPGVSLTSLRASVSSGVQVTGGTSDPLRNSLNQPAIELSGCAPSQAAVPQVIAAMRRMNGVQRVSLSSTQKGTAASGGGGDSTQDCRAGSDQRPQFSLTVFYAAPAAPATTTTGVATTTTTPGVAAAPATGATPAAPKPAASTPTSQGASG